MKIARAAATVLVHGGAASQGQGQRLPGMAGWRAGLLGTTPRGGSSRDPDHRPKQAAALGSLVASALAARSRVVEAFMTQGA